jgi:hypothetical protein
MDDEPQSGHGLSRRGNLGGIALGRNDAITGIVVPDVLRSDTAGDKVILTLMPDTYPSVEQIAQVSFF